MAKVAFNFDKAITESATTNELLLSAVVLGPSGAGKSSIMGTLPGKILFLHTTGESHGPKAARTTGTDRVVSICIDQDGGVALSPDAAYERLLQILTSADGIRALGVESIAIDGASEIETIIRGTDKWAAMCRSTQGKHNGFAEPTATITMFRPIICALKDLQSKLGVHYAVSCILDVKGLGADGEIVEASPRLLGFSVAESVLQQFDDKLVVGRMQRDGVVKHKLQFMTGMSKVSKDDRGTIKKAINYSPTVSGVLVQDLPEYMDADLSKVIEMKVKAKDDR